MKQNITPKQVRELSDSARKLYGRWCHKKGYFDYIGGVYEYNLLSIGQMIEFLEVDYLEKLVGGWVSSDEEIPKEKDLCNFLFDKFKRKIEISH